ncbi:putative mitochondrial protein [Andalucia godoyi]|uniref:Putative mitochondrial protein n=1 Tax=Andalucia godoyi TaxID=505711 RepID=A0A8K0AJZ0_ANDGO|nr:putative mitochondrial protein [Andalucia godoyi]|eukprot:ANDGO_05142.mRNA.1 putative mitochondrial protein
MSSSSPSRRPSFRSRRFSNSSSAQRGSSSSNRHPSPVILLESSSSTTATATATVTTAAAAPGLGSVASSKSPDSPALKSYVSNLLKQAEAFRRKKLDVHAFPTGPILQKQSILASETGPALSVVAGHNETPTMGDEDIVIRHPKRSSSVSRITHEGSSVTASRGISVATVTQIPQLPPPPSSLDLQVVSGAKLSEHPRSSSAAKRSASISIAKNASVSKHSNAVLELRSALHNVISILKMEEEEEIKKAKTLQDNSTSRGTPANGAKQTFRQDAAIQRSRGSARYASPAPTRSTSVPSSAGRSALVQRPASAMRSSGQRISSGPVVTAKTVDQQSPVVHVAPPPQHSEHPEDADVPMVTLSIPRMVMVSEELNRVREEVGKRTSGSYSNAGSDRLAMSRNLPVGNTASTMTTTTTTSRPGSPVSLDRLHATAVVTAARSQEQTVRLQENLRIREELLGKMRQQQTSSVTDRISQLESLRMRLESEERRLQEKYAEKERELEERESRVRAQEYVSMSRDTSPSRLGGHYSMLEDSLRKSSRHGASHSEFYERLIEILGSDQFAV